MNATETTNVYTVSGSLRNDNLSFNSLHGGLDSIRVDAVGGGVSSTQQSITLSSDTTQIDFTILVTVPLGRTQFGYEVFAGRPGADNGVPVDTTMTTVCVNQSPMANNDSASTNEDTVETGNVLSNDTDTNADNQVDDNIPLSVSRVNGVANSVGTEISVSGARLTVNSNGTFNFDPRGAFDHLQVGETQNVSFSYRASDGISSSDTSMTISVSGVNDQPVATPFTYSTDEDTSLSVSAANGLRARASDADNPDTDLTFAVTTDVPTSDGTLTLNSSDGSFVFDPAKDFNGNTSFQYTASDGSLTSLPATITISVDSKIDAPTITNFALDSGVIGDNTTNATQVTFTGTSEASVPGDTVAINIFRRANDELVATAISDANGDWTSNLSFASQAFIPDGDYTFYATATDSSGVSPESLEFSITVDTAAPILNSNSLVSELRSQIVTEPIIFNSSQSDGTDDLIEGFDIGDVLLQRQGNNTNLLPSTATFSSTNPDGDGFASTFALDGLFDVNANVPASNNTGTYTLSVPAAGSDITDRAGNSIQDSFRQTFAIDQTSPVFATNSPILQLPTIVGDLPVPVVQVSPNGTANVRIQVDAIDQQFTGFSNDLTFELVDVATGTVLDRIANVPIPAGTADDLAFTLPTQTLGADLAPGQHELRIDVRDASGNPQSNASDSSASSATLELYVFHPQAATMGSPSTPVVTTMFDIQEQLNEVIGVDSNQAIQPWQMSFDKTTQTVWFASEKAGTLAQFDPATGDFVVFDVNKIQDPKLSTMLATAANPGDTSIVVDQEITVGDTLTIVAQTQSETRVATAVTAIANTNQFRVTLNSELRNSHANGTTVEIRDTGDNPHGIFFDFNTHLTPRIFTAHRNAGGVNVSQNQEEGSGKLTYIDIGDEELVSFDFDEIQQRVLPSGKTVQQLLAENGIRKTFSSGNTGDLGKLDAFHAAFADVTGDVWVSVPESQVLLRFDFDGTDASCGLACDIADLTIHPLPPELSGDSDQPFNPHAFQVVVDDRIGKDENNQWVWAIDVAGSGRIALLRPGVGPGGTDAWTTWDFAPANVSGTFVQVDDNETPGIPEDDSIIATFPVSTVPTNGGGGGGGGGGGKPASAVATAGVVQHFSLAAPRSPLTSAAKVKTWTFPKIPGSVAGITNAGVIQPFVDRGGEVFISDRFGSVIRFDPQEFQTDIESFFSSDSSVAAVSIAPATPISVGRIEPTSITPFNENVVQSFTLDNAKIVDHLSSAHQLDRSIRTGVDQYELAGTNATNIFLDSRGPGAFRAALNASNVLYESLSQAEKLSVTVFAESTRRQMSAVASPLPAPTGAITQARMAFQVLRNGSLVLTARGDAMIADDQINLHNLLDSRIDTSASDVAKWLIEGEANAIAMPNGQVHVMARSALGGVVQFTFTPSGNDWEHNDLINATNWSARHIDVPGHILAEDVVPAGPLGFSVTTTDGHWLAISLDGSIRDITQESGNVAAARVYSAVGVTQTAEALYGYGTNQTGNLIEYRIDGNNVAVRQIDAEKRETRMLQNVRALTIDGTRHVFATDGFSRLVRYQIDSNGVTQENVTQTTVDQNQVFGYFDFEEPFGGRVYTYVAPLVEDDGTIRVYGTNGGELVEFTLPPGGQWRVANLTNDTNATYGADGPGYRVPANAVFGSPTAYIDDNGGRHILQINAEGEVVEYYTYGDKLFPNSVDADRINSQNVNFFSDKSPTDLAAELPESVLNALATSNTTLATTTTTTTETTADTTTETTTETTDDTPAPRVAMAEDVNQDGTVTAHDALLIINHLPRTVGATTASGEQTTSSPFNLDVNGDTQVTALDALRVINYLNKASTQSQAESIAIDIEDDDPLRWQSEVDDVMGDLGESQLF
ncbi:hypothetical protein RMSM_02727 [Rhodopirellula maiorica SM1]|uniref:Uncharacterized protein n=1 Tax=Rhodopirellula maiorica SM1 TaxID=1265738 RepID=M5S2E6_9BACT|nr:hypothetical protein RMSM_02727 [Rhodopirellula maiorica SM1]